MAADARSLVGSTLSGREATVMRGAGLDRQRAGGEVAIGGELGAQARQARRRGGVRRRAVDDDGDGVGRAAREVALEREQALLGGSVVRGAPCVPPSPMRRSSTGEASASSTAVVAIRLIAGRRMTARTARRQIGSLLAGRRRDPAPEPRDPQAIDAIAEDHQQRRVEGQRDQDGDDADDQGAQAEAAQRRVGHEQHRDHRQRERGAAEDDRARRRARDGRGSLRACPAAAVALLAQPGDDEQRVVDAEREAHRDDHVQDEQVERERLPDDRGDGERDDDRDDRHQHRDRDAEQRADHQQQHDERRRQPELQLALAQVARGELLEVAVQRVAAGDVRREARASVRRARRSR